jgi:tripartite-type tricarboxylate transporter receptor subunit TctC
MRRAVIAMLALLLAPCLARAQAPTVIVVNFGPGAANDVAARLLAAEFQAETGTPFIVKNTTGAAGTIGAQEVVRAKPDGQTLLLSPIGPVTIQPSYMRNAGYRTTDLAPICMVTDAALVIQTPRNSGLKTMADLVARARAQGGNMPYGSSGPGTVTHLSMVAWTRAAGVPMTHVPYRGPADVILAFQQGTLAVFADQPAMVRPQDLHVLAVFAPERLAEFPDAPTVKETGQDLSFSIWQGLFAPAATPEPILARYEAACARAMRTEAVRVGLDRIQTPLVHRNRADFAAIVARDAARMKAMIEEGGLRAAE